MNKSTYLAWLTVVLLLLFTHGMPGASAQGGQRIQFAKGRSSATVTGATGKFGVYYRIRAGNGQKMQIALTPKTGIGIKIEKGAGQVLLREEKGGTYTIYLEEGGDFSLFLGSTENKSRVYTLTVTITQMADI